MQLSDYYFIKCFDKQSYRDTFNSGELFFGHVKEYWGTENAFQQILKEEFSIKKEMGYLLLQNPDLKVY